MHFKIRPAKKEDCKEISRLIMELAVYEKMPDQVKIAHEELERDGFCENPFFQCLVAEVPEEHKSKEGFTVVGYALYFYTYSTWKGRSIFLEDLYVMPEFRGNGIGKGLLCKVAEVADCFTFNSVTLSSGGGCLAVSWSAQRLTHECAAACVRSARRTMHARCCHLNSMKAISA
ncbi:diamine acetyltransferase 2 isoform X2 [Oryzias latipes]|uniref:diamine acetyltransferase 2 isoform X2 n=1 Tax=Oryzias latipes TaxID=8090 RepID=UPI000CE17340|nr:diamine acetyltransferase 2 isoform X2 [Oryzias latipes]